MRTTQALALLGAVSITACSERQSTTAPSAAKPISAPISASITAAPGYAVSDFVTGFFCATEFCEAPTGLAFDAAGNLYVEDPGVAGVTSTLYRFGPSGGVASPSTQLGAALVGFPWSLTFAVSNDPIDGRLFLARTDDGDPPLDLGITEVDQTNGSVIRDLTPGFFNALATDPLSGDMFARGFSNSGISRISNIESGVGTVTNYASVGGAGGLAFDPAGSLWAVSVDALTEIAATNTQSPGAFITTIGVPNVAAGIAASANPATPSLFVNRYDPVNGGVAITKIDFTATAITFTDILTGGDGGYPGSSITVGPDGCLYATQLAKVIKISNADGTCLAPPLGPLLPDKFPPLLTVPGDQTVYATHPFGVVMSYEATATDNFGAVTVECSPSSGSTFPIGSVTVTCVATDPSGNQTSASFQITVLGATAQLEILESTVASLGLPDGIARSLTAKLDAALRAMSTGQVVSACAGLQAFINETVAQAGKKLSNEAANALSADAQRIKAVLGC